MSQVHNVTHVPVHSEEDKAGTQLVVVVNRKLAEQSWPGQDPVGKRLRAGTESTQTPWATVVGEVAKGKIRDMIPIPGFDIRVNFPHGTIGAHGDCRPSPPRYAAR